MDDGTTTEKQARESDDAPETKKDLHRDPEGDRDKGPRAANEARTTQRAEISNYEIVSHHFEQAAERLDMPDDIATVLKTSYREVQVQIPVRLSDDKVHVYSG